VLIAEGSNEIREMAVALSYVKQQAASSKQIHAIKCLIKENGSIYKSTRKGLTQEINGDGGST